MRDQHHQEIKEVEKKLEGKKNERDRETIMLKSEVNKLKEIVEEAQNYSKK